MRLGAPGYLGHDGDAIRAQVEAAEAKAEARHTRVMMIAAEPREVVETKSGVDAKGNPYEVETRRTEIDWRASESWLKRRRRVAWGDNIQIEQLGDDDLRRLAAEFDPSYVPLEMEGVSPHEP